MRQSVEVAERLAETLRENQGARCWEPKRCAEIRRSRQGDPLIRVYKKVLVLRAYCVPCQAAFLAGELERVLKIAARHDVSLGCAQGDVEEEEESDAIA